jgi:hypothetical protein
MKSKSTKIRPPVNSLPHGLPPRRNFKRRKWAPVNMSGMYAHATRKVAARGRHFGNLRLLPSASLTNLFWVSDRARRISKRFMLFDAQELG